MGPVLVFGHRNPDNDSVCSAVAYAHLKNLTEPHDVFLPAVLGEVPAETRWLFDRFGVELPERIAHVRTRVRDVMADEVVTVAADRPMLEAGRLMREHNVRSLPVVDAEGRLVGLLGQSGLAERYLHQTEIGGFSRMPVTVAQLAEALEGEVVCGDPDAEISGDVLIGADEPSTLAARIAAGDVLIVGDRLRTQPVALEAGAACVVLTRGAEPSEAVLELARERGAALVSTPHDAFSAARLVSLAHAVGDVMDTDVPTCGDDTLLAEASEDLLASPHRVAVVVDEERRVIGILTRTTIARGNRRRVVLVDHNEVSQSADGIEDAAVVEIVDHHRVGDIQTAGPVLFLNLPVGATATIVAERYQTLGVPLPDPMAGVLLGAILTDTVLLKSPTATEVDRRVVERLAAKLELDFLEFGMELFRARSAGMPFSAQAVVGADCKEYRVGELTVGIAQYETVDLAAVMEHAEEVRHALESLRAEHGWDVAVVMLTDIVREGSELMAAGSVRLVERALGVDLASGSAWMPGVLSRKKQVAARLAEAAGA